MNVGEISSYPPCTLYSSKKSSDIRAIAKRIVDGGVYGVPTDTVYGLVASCRRPDSIRKLFDVKQRSKNKPISLCLGNLEQLKEAKPQFSPLLLTFIERCSPEAITCVVPKGDWLQRLGIVDTQVIGTESTVGIHIPDCTPLVHLLQFTGSIALTSANISGEPDSTHHDMVIERLGDKLDGVLCDGHSKELVASTVVNCLNIDNHEISYIREGCYPKEKVDRIFSEVLDDYK